MKGPETEPYRAAAPEMQDAVWRELWQRQRPHLEGRMCTAFLAGLERAGLDPSRMPRHADLSRRLYDLCGWRIETVPGLIPPRDFFALLRDRRFPSPEWIRSPDELDYTPAPDAFHDVFGHVPQLCAPEVTDLLDELAELARDADDGELAEVERLYWFTVEFGLVRERGELRALGAGLGSSFGELERSLEDPDVERIPFDPVDARQRSFWTDRPQDVYLVLESLVERPRLAR